MRIVVIGPVRTKKHFGGVASVVEGLAEGLLQQGQEALILTDYTDKDSTEGGVPVRAYRKSPEGRSPFCSKAMIRELKAMKPDWIIGSLHYSKVNREARKFCRVMTFLHGFPTTASMHEFLLIRHFTRSYVKHSDKVVINSSFAQTVNRDILGIHTDFYVPLGIDRNSLAYFEAQADRPKKKQVVFAGRLIPFKRVDRIIRGFRRSELPGKGYELVIVGSGRSEESLKKMAADDTRIRFTGRMDSSALLDCYLDAEIFTSLNAHEPFGIVFLEALAAGCKVLAPRTGGQTDIMKHFPSASLATDPYSVDAVAEDMNRILSLPVPERKDMLRIISNEFTYRNTASLILKELESDRNKEEIK